MDGNVPWTPSAGDMMKHRSPCKGCEERHVGCHDRCERYLKAVEEARKAKDEIHQKLKMESIADRITDMRIQSGKQKYAWKGRRDRKK